MKLFVELIIVMLDLLSEFLLSTSYCLAFMCEILFSHVPPILELSISHPSHFLLILSSFSGKHLHSKISNRVLVIVISFRQRVETAALV